MYRYPGVPGLKIAAFWFCREGESDVKVVPPGSRLWLNMILDVELEQDFAAQVFVTFWVKAKRIARCVSPVMRFRGSTTQPEGVHVDLSPFILQRGEYDVSLSLYDRVGEERRYDVLMRCWKLTVPGDAPAWFEHPAHWTFSPVGE